MVSTISLYTLIYRRLWAGMKSRAIILIFIPETMWISVRMDVITFSPLRPELVWGLDNSSVSVEKYVLGYLMFTN